MIDGNFAQLSTSKLPRSLLILCVFVLCHSPQVLAGQIKLAWDASSDSNVGGYRVFYGKTSQNYSASVDVGNQTQYTVTGLAEGNTFFFAVTAYDKTGTIQSDFSNEVTGTIGSTAPKAGFTASSTSGTAPLTVNFSDTSTGNVKGRFWEFGDGATSTALNPSHTYTAAGAYSVRLTVTGAGATDTKTKTNYIIVSNEGGSGGRVTDGQVVLYTFEEETGDVVRDVSGVGTPLDLTISKSTAVQWLSGGGISIDAATAIRSKGSATKVQKALQASQALTLEAWVAPANATQDGPARIVALSRNGKPEGGNFVLGQRQDQYAMRLRTSITDQYGKPELLTLPGTAKNRLKHLVYTRDASGATWLYIDGVQHASDTVGGDFSNWGDYGLALANEPAVDQNGKNRPWLGELHLVALYDRALTRAEVNTNFEAGPDSGVSALMEAGEVQVDNQWRRVNFTRPFVDPVVVAKPASAFDPDPAVVRIRNVDAGGFEIRIQEWDYLDGIHDFESVGYLVMERGVHILADGTQVEAGRFESNQLTSTQTVTFGQAFQVRPVVLAAVTSFNGAHPVVSRLSNINTTSFAFRMQEQGANLQSHVLETISFIAWEPSAGTTDGLAFAVNHTGNAVTHVPYRIDFPGTLTDTPIFLADMQTTDDPDTANLRWNFKDLSGVDVYVAEEQSGDSGMSHTTEAVGYLLISPVD